MSRYTDVATPVLPFEVAQAIRSIREDTGDIVSIPSKAKSLIKFGKNDDLGTSFETVWNTQGDETYVTTNAIDKFSSSSGSDTFTMRVEGHTVTGAGADAQFTFAIQDITLAGQTETALGTPLARISRAYVLDSSIPVGDIYFYEDDTVVAGVPQTAANVHLKILAGETQSFKAATTMSNVDYWIITGGYASVNKKTSASVDFQLEVRQVGGAFRPAAGRIALNATGQSTMQVFFKPCVYVPKNADMRVRAIASTTGVSVDATIHGYLAHVVGTVG